MLTRLDTLTQVKNELARNGYRADANETMAFARQLEHIMASTYDVESPEVKWRSILPVNTEVEPGALFHTFRQFTPLGAAKIVSSYGANDFPSTDLTGAEFTTPIVSLGASYGYSIQEMRSAAMMKVSIDQKKAEAVRLSFEQRLDILAAVGDAGTKIPGITNAGGISTLTSVPNGGTLNGSWDDPNTPVETILADLNKAQAKIMTDTKGVYGSNLSLKLPISIYSALATRPRSVGFTDDSVLQYMLKQSPWLKSVDFWTQLEALGHNSATTAGYGLLKDESPRVCEIVIPQDFEQMPPALDGMLWRIMCHSRTGGVVVHYPKAIVSLDGLSK